MIWRATGRLGRVSWAWLAALQPRKGLSLTRGGPVTLWVCQQSPLSLPGAQLLLSPVSAHLLMDS